MQLFSGMRSAMPTVGQLRALGCSRSLRSGFSTWLGSCKRHNTAPLQIIRRGMDHVQDEAKPNSMNGTFGNFDLIKQVKLSYTDVTISKWRSRVTGLSVVHLDYEAPIVNGYFVVGTEIFNDSGCPHTLEHLVFMGSEKYPYKGIIDHFANRGFSNGTNAWTDTDHTAYTVSTAGEQGFLQILPIYVDHILYPTLTKSGFLTEVHHIDPKGEDSGVVYSEMQGRENTSGDLMALRMQRILNPAGSAYRSETGGLMEALRVLTVEQIREYHATYYVPHNLSLIVAGKMSNGTQTLLDVIQNQIEPSLIAHKQNAGPRPPGWKRPFVETSSANRKPVSENTKEVVEFPERDESLGELTITFTGPAPNQHLERKAINLLGSYLTSSAAAPLNKEYVEVDSPLCTYIYFSETTSTRYCDIPIYVGSVPAEHLDTLDERIKKSLEKIAHEGLDMDRMIMVIKREERQLKSRLESAKGDAFSTTMIDDFLYGAEDGSELHSAVDDINQFSILKVWTGEDWKQLMLKYFVNKPSAVVIGKPSQELVEKLETDEKERIKAQVEKLGPEGLKHAERELQDAKTEHDQPIPKEVITSFKVPNVKSISWIGVQSLQEPGIGRKARGRTENKLAKAIESDGKPLPFFVQYDHVQSDFVTIRGVFSLARLPDRLRPHVTTYLTAFFNLPVNRASGERLTYEEVVNKLDDETVSYDALLGFTGELSEVLTISIRVEVSRYGEAVAWLKDSLYNAEFNRDRLQVTIVKIQQSLPEQKREGSTVLNALSTDVLFAENSTSKAGTLLTQSDFLQRLAAQLRESPDEVISDFKEIRRYLTDPGGVRFSVAGNVLDSKNPRSIWEKHFAEMLPPKELLPVPLSHDTLSSLGKNPAKKATVMSLPTIESSFVQCTSKGLRSFDDPEWPALRMAIEIMNATESYLWRYIRGSGLAYGAYLSHDSEAGLLSFTLYRSSNCIQALEEGKKVVQQLVDGTVTMDQTGLDAARSGIVSSTTKTLSTASRVAVMSFLNQALKDIPQDYQAKLLEKCQSVSKDQVVSALQKYILPLFDSSSSIVNVVTAPSKAESISESLAKNGFEVERRTMEVDPNEDGEESSSGDDEESEDER